MLLDPHIQRSLLNDILAATPGTERAVALEKRKDLVERYTLVFVRMGRNYGEPHMMSKYALHSLLSDYASCNSLSGFYAIITLHAAMNNLITPIMLGYSLARTPVYIDLFFPFS